MKLSLSLATRVFRVSRVSPRFARHHSPSTQHSLRSKTKLRLVRGASPPNPPLGGYAPRLASPVVSRMGLLSGLFVASLLTTAESSPRGLRPCTPLRGYAPKNPTARQALPEGLRPLRQASLVGGSTLCSPRFARSGILPNPSGRPTAFGLSGFARAYPPAQSFALRGLGPLRGTSPFGRALLTTPFPRPIAQQAGLMARERCCSECYSWSLRSIPSYDLMS